jgi:adenosine deaminase CECR1
MSLYSWKQLARWSLDYSCLTDKEKRDGHGYLNDSWKKFCQAVVVNYDKQLMKGDEVDPDKAEREYIKPVATS